MKALNNKQIAYFLRSKATGKMISAFEGEDGKARAEELAAIQAKHYPHDTYTVSEELI